MISDTLCYLRAEIILKSFAIDIQEKVRLFDGMFYTLLVQEVGISRLSRWTKRYDLFSLDFVFIPILLNLHFTLCVIVRPIEWLLEIFPNAKQNSDITQKKNKACLLYLNSIHNYNRFEPIAKNIKKYLSDLWKKEESITKPPTTYENTTYSEIKMRDYKEQICQNEEYKICSKNDTCLFEGIPVITCHTTPQQAPKSNDCGIFVYKFIELMTNLWPTSIDTDLESSFTNFINPSSISLKEVYDERQIYKDLLAEAHLAWVAEGNHTDDDEESSRQDRNDDHKSVRIDGEVNNNGDEEADHKEVVLSSIKASLLETTEDGDDTIEADIKPALQFYLKFELFAHTAVANIDIFCDATVQYQRIVTCFNTGCRVLRGSSHLYLCFATLSSTACNDLSTSSSKPPVSPEPQVISCSIKLVNNLL